MDAILKASLPKLREKLLEALQAVLPIVAIRYSFAYVWGLPVLLILLFLRPEKEEL